MPLIVVSLLPGLLWLWWFARKASGEQPGWSQLGQLFVLGCLSAGLAIVAGTAVADACSGLLAELSDPLGPMAATVIGTGLVEEASKLLVVLLFLVWTRRRAKPIQVALWAVAAALGFATVENYLFVQREGAQLMLMRGPISTLVHAVFSSLWGLALGTALQARGIQAARFVVAGLLAASLAHGAFNLILAAAAASSSAAVSFGIIPLLLLLYHFLVKALRDNDEALTSPQSSGRHYLVFSGWPSNTRR